MTTNLHVDGEWDQLANLTGSWSSIIRALRQQHQPRRSPTLPDLSFPSLDLITPFDVNSVLDSWNVAPQVKSRALQKLHLALADAQKLHIDNYRKACQQYTMLNLDNPAFSLSRHRESVDSFCRAEELSYAEYACEIRDDFLAACTRLLLGSPLSKAQKRPPFNPDAVPLLERSFELNPFPNAADREWLARQSSMSVEQIAVWFQNHRRRARAEGRRIERVVTTVLPSVVPASQISSPFAPQAPAATSCLDQIIPPPHVFPEPYSSPAGESGKKVRGNFAPPVWTRAPATKLRASATTLTIDELCSAFQVQLRMPQTPARASTKPSTKEPWYASKWTGPICAPIPALIRPRTSRLVKSSPDKLPTSRKTKKPQLQQRRTLLAEQHIPYPTPARCKGGSLSRKASDSSISSSASSGSEPVTPEASPNPFSVVELPQETNLYRIGHAGAILPVSYDSATFGPSFEKWAYSPKSLTSTLPKGPIGARG